MISLRACVLFYVLKNSDIHLLSGMLRPFPHLIFGCVCFFVWIGVETKGEEAASSSGKKAEAKQLRCEMAQTKEELKRIRRELERVRESLHLAQVELGSKAIQIEDLTCELAAASDQLKHEQEKSAALTRDSETTDLPGPRPSPLLQGDVVRIRFATLSPYEAEPRLEPKTGVRESDKPSPKVGLESLTEVTAATGPETAKMTTATATTTDAARRMKNAEVSENRFAAQESSGAAGPLILATLLFEKHSAVSREERDRIEKDIKAVLEQFPQARFRLTGHADDYPYEQSNRDVSLNRARFLALHLESRGIAKDRLIVEAKGSGAPSPKGNRRVEVEVLLEQ